MKKVIGRITTYCGKEQEYLSGYDLKIVAVLHNAAVPGIDVDGPDYDCITDDYLLEQMGGVTANDRIDVQPWMEKQGRFSFVSSDPLAVDLACFAELKSDN